jgi:DNA-binding GntR family transcriptional regulator
MPASPRHERLSSIAPLPFQPTVREAAYRRLRQLIVDGSLAPNERIFENELAEQFGISRTPLREALRQLETEGLVHFIARRGAVVAGLSSAEMREEFEIRATLERLAIRLAGPRLGPAELGQLRGELTYMQQALTRGDRAAFREHHRLFHMTIFERAEAPRLLRMLTNLLEIGERYEYLELAHDTLHADEIGHHARLLENLEASDIQTAADEYAAEFLSHGEEVIEQLIQADRHR